MSKTRTEWNEESAHQRVKRAALGQDLLERLSWLSSAGDAYKCFGSVGNMPDWVRNAAMEQIRQERSAVVGLFSDNGEVIIRPTATAEDVASIADKYAESGMKTAKSVSAAKYRSWLKGEADRF